MQKLKRELSRVKEKNKTLEKNFHHGLHQRSDLIKT